MFKKINLLRMATTAMVLSAFVLASCVSEQETPEVTASDLVTRSVTFNIQLPSGDPVHFTRAQEGNEAVCNSLRLLIFDPATNILVGNIDMLDGSNAATLSSNVYSYTYQPEAGTLARRFVVVANDALTGVSVNNNTTYAQLQDQLAAVTLASNDAISNKFDNLYLPMSGVATFGGSNIIPMDGTDDVPVTVTLTRAVARIDVANKVPNLVITDLKLINANPNGYLMPHRTTGNVAVPANMTRVGGLSPATAISSITTADGAAVDCVFQPASTSTPGTPAVTETPAVLKKAFYVYEDAIQDPSSTPLTLQVQGTLGGVIPVFYNIPFVNANLSTPTNDGKSLEIQRNYLYTLTIGNGTAVNINTSMATSLSYADWGGEEVAGVFNFNFFEGTTTSPNTYSIDTQKFSVAATTTAIGSINVISGFYNSADGVAIKSVQVQTTGADWTPATAANSATDGWLTASKGDGLKQTVTLEATPNETNSVRTGSVRITYQNSTNDQTDRYVVFSVTQAAANP